MGERSSNSVSSAGSAMHLVCPRCGNFRQDDVQSIEAVEEEVMSRCSEWLSSGCSLADTAASSEPCSESSRTSLCTDSECGGSEVDFVPDISEQIVSKKEASTFGYVKVLNSERVLIGNKTIINGPVYINSSSTTTHQTNTFNQVMLDPSVNKKVTGKPLRIISRRDWLAQPPLLRTQLPESVKYVIICHTATEEGFTNADNIHLIRLMQTYHIESRKWDDIAYNFLVGSDGVVYEGRGWGQQGAFAYGYNPKALGIAFVGCFVGHLPPPAALHAARELIKRGVDLGHVPGDYALVGHCQCSAVESPGKRLFEEIQTWDRWRELTREDV